jgi:hypothetical protein
VGATLGYVVSKRNRQFRCLRICAHRPCSSTVYVRHRFVEYLWHYFSRVKVHSDCVRRRSGEVVRRCTTWFVLTTCWWYAIPISHYYIIHLNKNRSSQPVSTYIPIIILLSELFILKHFETIAGHNTIVDAASGSTILRRAGMQYKRIQPSSTSMHAAVDPY